MPLCGCVRFALNKETYGKNPEPGFSRYVGLRPKKITIPDFRNIIWYSQMRFLAFGHNNSSLFVCFLVGIPKKTRLAYSLRKGRSLFYVQKRPKHAQ